MIRFVIGHANALLLVLIAVTRVMAFCTPKMGSTWLRPVSRGFVHVARRQGLSVILVGLLALWANVGVSLLGHFPQPRIHDEFSYLLAADTLAHGRLSNPTHPLWVHFESFHVIHHPTYASKYPPAQGLMLALGQVLGGHPIVGVWISTGLACAVICWMLQAWLPLRWALLGGLFASAHPAILLVWGQSYMGGATAVLGGALTFGALRRIVRRPYLRDALLMGLGLAILANSRPFEGLVVSLPALATLLGWMVSKHGPAWEVSVGHIALPMLAVLGLTAAMMGSYNAQVSGDALRLPYLVHEATYAVAPMFLWQSPRPKPTYRHKAIDDFHTGWSLRQYTSKCTVQQCSLMKLLQSALKQLLRIWKFFLGPVLTIPLVMLLWVLKNRWNRLALLTCSLLVAAMLLSIWAPARYAAPITALILMLVLQAMRHLRLCRWHGRPMGQFIVRVIPLLYMTSFVLSMAHAVQPNPADVWSIQRAHILKQLQAGAEQHLVIVRYGATHSPHDEWVYNEADIDGAKVVWAREMDAAQNGKLLEYFHGRRVWILEADTKEPHLVPYGTESRR